MCSCSSPRRSRSSRAASRRWAHPTTSAPSHAGLEVVDGRGRIAIPGLIDCHTHPAFGGQRAGEFELRAQGAGYERIHASGGGIAATVAATRRLGRDGLQAAVARHLGWMAAHGTTTAEGKSGYGLDRDTELASLDAIAAAHPIESVPTYLGAHSVPAEFSDGDDYLDFALAEVLPEAARVAEAADVFLERGRSAPSRPSATCGRRPGTAWRCGSTATSSPRRARSRLRSSSARDRSTTSRRPVPTASSAWPRATSRPCCYRSPRCTCAGRCRPPGR